MCSWGRKLHVNTCNQVANNALCQYYASNVPDFILKTIIRNSRVPNLQENKVREKNPGPAGGKSGRWAQTNIGLDIVSGWLQACNKLAKSPGLA